MNYPGYRARIRVEFYPAASFVPSMENEVLIEHLTGADGEVVSQTPTVDEVVEIPVRPPNAVREAAELPTPVLTQDSAGNPVEKWVQRKGQPPKNKIVGSHLGPEPAITMVPTAIVAHK